MRVVLTIYKCRGSQLGLFALPGRQVELDDPVASISAVDRAALGLMKLQGAPGVAITMNASPVCDMRQDGSATIGAHHD